MTEEVCGAHGNAENVVTTRVHLVMKRHYNPGWLAKVYKIMCQYKELHPSQAKTIDEIFREHFNRVPFLIKGACKELRIREPKLGRAYCYAAHSCRYGGKVRKTVRYLGRAEESLSLKDIVWLLTARTDFLDVEEWREGTVFDKWPPLGTVKGLDLTYAIKWLLKKNGLTPCSSDYVIQKGFPKTFKELFDKYGLTDIITGLITDHAHTRLTSEWQEYTVHFSGTSAEFDKVKEFLENKKEVPT